MIPYGLKIVSYTVPFFWAELPYKYKNSTSLSELKKMERWSCPCRLCKGYMPNMDIASMKEAWKVPYSYNNFTQININNKKCTPFLYPIFIIYINFSGLYRSNDWEDFFSIAFYGFCDIMIRDE